MVNNNGKKTLGRRKIEIKKIEKKTSLQVTFTKRRSGLFRKAAELCVLCGSDVAILVQSPAGKMFGFEHPSLDYLINRFEAGLNTSSPPEMVASSSHVPLFMRREENYVGKYAEAVRKLERVKDEEKGSGNSNHNEYNWWDDLYEGMELHELEEFGKALEELRDNVVRRVDEIERNKLVESTASLSNVLGITSGDHDDVVGDQGFDGQTYNTTTTNNNNVGAVQVFDNDQDFDGGKSSIEEAQVEEANDGQVAVTTGNDMCIASAAPSNGFLMNPNDDEDFYGALFGDADPTLLGSHI